MIVGISGKIGSGKDEVGRLIQRHSTRQWEVKKFATKLKQIVEILTGRTVAELETSEVKNAFLTPQWGAFRMHGFVTMDREEMEIIMNGVDKTAVKLGFGSQRSGEEAIDYWMVPTYRQLMQWIGTEAMREVIHPDVWVNALFADVDYDKPTEHPNWLVTDLRFPNEDARIKSFQGKRIRVERPGIAVIDHISETALDKVADWDYVLFNNGTLEDLERKVKEMIDYLAI